MSKLTDEQIASMVRQICDLESRYGLDEVIRAAILLKALRVDSVNPRALGINARALGLNAKSLKLLRAKL